MQGVNPRDKRRRWTYLRAWRHPVCLSMQLDINISPICMINEEKYMLFVLQSAEVDTIKSRHEEISGSLDRPIQWVLLGPCCEHVSHLWLQGPECPGIQSTLPSKKGCRRGKLTSNHRGGEKFESLGRRGLFVYCSGEHSGEIQVQFWYTNPSKASHSARPAISHSGGLQQKEVENPLCGGLHNAVGMKQYHWCGIVLTSSHSQI